MLQAIHRHLESFGVFDTLEGYSASTRNTSGISHTPQLPQGLSITYTPYVRK